MTALVKELFPPDTPRPKVSIYFGDVREQLRHLPSESVQVVVTSPPYYQLRNYQTPLQVWGGVATCSHQFEDAFCIRCKAWQGSLGLEPTPDMFIGHLVEIFEDVRRVLRDDGVLFLNLGDSYARSGGTDKQASSTASVGNTLRTMELRGDRTQDVPAGLKAKDLIGVPWQTALALRDAGWYLRADNIWAKASSGQRDFVALVEQTALDLGIPNEYIYQLINALELPVGTCMPQSVDDRTTVSHEYVFMLTKSEHYFYDHEAVKESFTGYSLDAITKAGGVGGTRPNGNNFNKEQRRARNSRTPSTRASRARLLGSGGRNLRSVWTINPKPYKGSHYATFPPELPRLCIKAGVSEYGCCATCLAPYERIVEKDAPLVDQQAACGASADGGYHGTAQKAYKGTGAQDPSSTKARILAGMREHVTVGWQKTCSCDTDRVVPCTVLDPFVGSGTTMAEAHALGHAAIGIDLDVRNLSMIEDRIRDIDPHSEVVSYELNTPDAAI